MISIFRYTSRIDIGTPSSWSATTPRARDRAHPPGEWQRSALGARLGAGAQERLEALAQGRARRALERARQLGVDHHLGERAQAARDLGEAARLGGRRQA